MRSLEKRSVFSGVDEDKNMRMKKKHGVQNHYRWSKTAFLGRSQAML